MAEKLSPGAEMIAKIAADNAAKKVAEKLGPGAEMIAKIAADNAAKTVAKKLGPGAEMIAKIAADNAAKAADNAAKTVAKKLSPGAEMIAKIAADNAAKTKNAEAAKKQAEAAAKKQAEKDAKAQEKRVRVKKREDVKQHRELVMKVSGLNITQLAQQKKDEGALAERKAQLDALKKSMKDMGLNISDNKKIAKEEAKIAKDEIKLQTQNKSALTKLVGFMKPGGDKEKQNEERRGAKRMLDVLGSIKSGIGSMASKAKDKAKAVAGGAFDMLKKGALFLAIPALIAFMQSPMFEDLKKWVVDTLIPALKNLVDIIVPIAQKLGAWVSGSLLPEFFDMLKKHWDSLTTMVSGIVDKVKVLFGPDATWNERIGALLGIFDDIGTFVFDAVRNLGVMILNLFGVDGEALAKKYWDPIAKFFGDIVDSVLLIFTDPVAGIKKLFATYWGAATGIGAWIYDIGIKPIVAWLKEKFEFIGKGIAGTWTGLVGFIKEKFDGVITFLTDLFTWPKTPLGFVTKLIDIILLPYNLVINFLRDIFGWGTDEEGKTTPFSLGTFIVDTILAVVTWVKEKFAFAAGAVIEGWTGLKTFIVDAAIAVKDWIVDKFTFGVDAVIEGWTGLKTFIADGAIAIKDWIVDKFTFGKDAVIAGWNGLVTFVTDLGVKVWTWFKDLFSWGTQGDGADGDDKTLLGYIIGIPSMIWTWIKGIFGFGTQGDGADGDDKTLLGYIIGIPGKIWTWFKGLFGWGKDPDGADGDDKTLLGYIAAIPGKIWTWFKGIFTFGGDEKEEGEETTTLWGWLKGIPGRIWNWIKGIFGFGETDPEAKEAGKGFSLWSIVTDSITALGKWFADLFDIDWSQLIADMTPKWVKDLPFVGKWFGGSGEVGDAVINEAVGEHGQTLKGAKEAGLYDEDSLGASEINKEALQQGVKSGAVQKEMLQAIIDDKDLRDEDLAFMKTLVEQATKKRSLYVADLGLHERLDTLLGMSSNEQMNSFEMKAGRDFAMNAMRQSMISQPPAGAGGGGSSTVMITNAPSTSNVANTKVETAAGVSDPHTQLAGVY